MWPPFMSANFADHTVLVSDGSGRIPASNMGKYTQSSRNHASVSGDAMVPLMCGSRQVHWTARNAGLRRCTFLAG